MLAIDRFGCVFALYPLMMLLKILFWLAMAVDTAAVLLLFVLGLAAAGPSHTSPLSVFFLLLIAPGVVLAGLGFLFLRTQSTPLQLLALAILMAPVLFVATGIGMQGFWRLMHPQESKQQMAFKPVSLAEVEAAVLRNDVEGVKKTAAAAGLRGHQGGAGVIQLALLRLQKSPEQLPVFKALLEAGADPSRGYGEAPLKVAIECSPGAGLEPVRLLLDAGAKPNALDQLGVPVYFAAFDRKVDVEVLKLLIDRGADVNLKTYSGEAALSYARAKGNQKAIDLIANRP